ncbi:MAG TPA: YncE family protein [Solirubrobacteraceae bacterium]|nr:YncE family protein [Solirubrobacteraceae bacterium]
MDENWVRQVLATALGDEPPIGPVARNSLRAGIRLRRRLRMRRAAGGAAAVAVAAAVIPAAHGVFGHTAGGPRTAAPFSPPKVPRVPTGTAYVINSGGGTVTPIDLATGTAGKPIDIAGEPVALTAAPDGKTAYVATGATSSRGPSSNQTVTPIDLTTNTAGKPIIFSNPADAIAITPDGRTGYVIDGFPSRTVTRVNLATDKPGKQVTLSAPPQEIAMAPDGKTAYLIIAVGVSNADRPRNLYYFARFDLATSKLGKRLKLSGQPASMAIARNGKTAYLVSQSSSTVVTVTPIDLRTLRAEKAINIITKPLPTKGYIGRPLAIAIAPDGMTAYVADGASSTVTPVDLATGALGKQISLTGKIGSDAIAISSNGAAAYVANQPSSTVTPINLATNTAETPIKIGGGWDSGFEAIVTVP